VDLEPGRPKIAIKNRKKEGGFNWSLKVINTQHFSDKYKFLSSLSCKFFAIFWSYLEPRLALGLDSAHKTWIRIRIHDTTVFFIFSIFYFLYNFWFSTLTQAESVRWRRLRPSWLQQHTSTQQKERTYSYQRRYF
jgi:hypothetical protein